MCGQAGKIALRAHVMGKANPIPIHRPAGGYSPQAQPVLHHEPNGEFKIKLKSRSCGPAVKNSPVGLVVKNLSSRSEGEERPRDGAVDLGSGLRSIQRLNQHITQTTALVNQRSSFLFRNRFRPNQQFQPVVSFVTFFQ